MIDTDALLANAKPESRYLGWYEWFGWMPDAVGSELHEYLPYSKSKLMADNFRCYRTTTAALSALREAVRLYREQQEGNS